MVGRDFYTRMKATSSDGVVAHLGAKEERTGLGEAETEQSPIRLIRKPYHKS